MGISECTQAGIPESCKLSFHKLNNVFSELKEPVCKVLCLISGRILCVHVGVHECTHVCRSEENFVYLLIYLFRQDLPVAPPDLVLGI